jgi:fructose-1-phosphate kinase PfkB-like protein
MIAIISASHLLLTCKADDASAAGVSTNFTVLSQQASGLGLELAWQLRQANTKSKVYTIIGGFNGYKLKDLSQKQQIKLKYLRTQTETGQVIVSNNQSFTVLPAAYSKNEAETFAKLILADAAKFTKVIFTDFPQLPDTFYPNLTPQLLEKNPQLEIEHY